MNPLCSENTGCMFRRQTGTKRSSNFQRFMINRPDNPCTNTSRVMNVTKTFVHEIHAKSSNKVNSCKETPRADTQEIIKDRTALSRPAENLSEVSATEKNSVLKSDCSNFKSCSVDKRNPVYTGRNSASSEQVDDHVANTGNVTVVSLVNSRATIHQKNSFENGTQKRKSRKTGLCESNNAGMEKLGVLVHLPQCRRKSGRQGIEQRLKYLSPIISISCSGETADVKESSAESPMMNKQISPSLVISADSTDISTPSRLSTLRKRETPGCNRIVDIVKFEVLHQSCPRDVCHEKGIIFDPCLGTNNNPDDAAYKGINNKVHKSVYKSGKDISGSLEKKELSLEERLQSGFPDKNCPRHIANESKGNQEDCVQLIATDNQLSNQDVDFVETESLLHIANNVIDDVQECGMLPVIGDNAAIASETLVEGVTQSRRQYSANIKNGQTKVNVKETINAGRNKGFGEFIFPNQGECASLVEGSNLSLNYDDWGYFHKLRKRAKIDYSATKISRFGLDKIRERKENETLKRKAKNGNAEQSTADTCEERKTTAIESGVCGMINVLYNQNESQTEIFQEESQENKSYTACHGFCNSSKQLVAADVEAPCETLTQLIEKPISENSGRQRYMYNKKRNNRTDHSAVEIETCSSNDAIVADRSHSLRKRAKIDYFTTKITGNQFRMDSENKNTMQTGNGKYRKANDKIYKTAENMVLVGGCSNYSYKNDNFDRIRENVALININHEPDLSTIPVSESYKAVTEEVSKQGEIELLMRSPLRYYKNQKQVDLKNDSEVASDFGSDNLIIQNPFELDFSSSNLKDLTPEVPIDSNNSDMERIFVKDMTPQIQRDSDDNKFIGREEEFASGIGDIRSATSKYSPNHSDLDTMRTDCRSNCRSEIIDNIDNVYTDDEPWKTVAFENESVLSADSEKEVCTRDAVGFVTDYKIRKTGNCENEVVNNADLKCENCQRVYSGLITFENGYSASKITNKCNSDVEVMNPSCEKTDHYIRQIEQSEQAKNQMEHLHQTMIEKFCRIQKMHKEYAVLATDISENQKKHVPVIPVYKDTNDTKRFMSSNCSSVTPEKVGSESAEAETSKSFYGQDLVQIDIFIDESDSTQARNICKSQINDEESELPATLSVGYISNDSTFDSAANVESDLHHHKRQMTRNGMKKNGNDSDEVNKTHDNKKHEELATASGYISSRDSGRQVGEHTVFEKNGQLDGMNDTQFTAEHSCSKKVNENHTSQEQIDTCTTKENGLEELDRQAGVIVGSVVWGMFRRDIWWTALVVDGEMIRKSTKEGFVWLYWLSDRQISQIKMCCVEPLHVKFTSRCKHYKNKKMQLGIAKALAICAERADIDVAVFGGVGAWANSDSNGGFLHVNRDLFKPKSDCPVPANVLDDLHYLPGTTPSPPVPQKPTGFYQANGSSNPFTASTCQEPTGKQRYQPESAVSGDVCFDGEVVDVEGDDGLAEARCLACGVDSEVNFNHLLFQAKICRRCMETIKESYYAVDEDGSSMFCGICGEGGCLYVCSDGMCGRAYCFSCVEKHASSATVKLIKEAEHWRCFLCSDYSRVTHGDLVPHTDLSLEAVKFFQAGQVSLCNDLQYLKGGSRRRIRVLSLFDGIGSGKVALDDLGLDVDVYYASEISADAMLVSNFHHNPVQLGDAWQLDKAKLRQLCPIDLVLAGPPCNDLSIVNPDRKGFNGTGILMWKFISILKDIEGICSTTNHVFWLMENTGSMIKEYKLTICKEFGMEPAVWDAKYFSGHRRARNFWGNIPGMYSTPKFCKQLEKDKTDLDAALISNCNRKAVVSHTRTITSSSNSLTVTNGVNKALVSMNGKPDHIWVQELERLFGFMTHYTDVGHLTHDRRRKLIGKAWSIPVIKHLLSPLKQYFKVKDA